VYVYLLTMPWGEIHKIDNDGNTVITGVKTHARAEDVLREFRKRNHALKENAYISEIQSQLLPNYGRKRTRIKHTKDLSGGCNRKFKTNNTNKGVWSELTKPYKPAGDMGQHEATKATFNIRIQRMKNVYKKKRYDKLRMEHDEKKRRERMKILNANKLGKFNDNDFPTFTPSEAEFSIKTRSIRINPSAFPANVLKCSEEMKNAVKYGQKFGNGMKSIDAKIKNMHTFLQLIPNVNCSSELPTSQGDFNTNMDEVALDMKNKTNGKIVVQENARPSDDLVHLLTADAGVNAKIAAAHTEKCRLENLKNIKNNRHVITILKQKKEKIKRRAIGYPGRVRKECQMKVEHWIDSFLSTGSEKDKLLGEKIILRQLDQVEVANHAVKDFDTWGFETGPISLSPPKTKKNKWRRKFGQSNDFRFSEDSTSTKGGAQDMLSFWNLRRFEVLGILEDALIGRETAKLYRDLLVFACVLEGKNGLDELDLIQFLKEKFELGFKYNKTLFCEAWHIFSSRVTKNLRLGFVFKYLYDILGLKK
jgi:hypothetical protein